MSSALFVSDSHLGDSTHDDGLGWREAEAWRIAAAIVAHVEDNADRIKVVVLTGDVFHTRKPQPWAMKVFVWLTTEIRRYTQLRVIPGNHDADPQGGTGPLSIGFLTDDELVRAPRVETFGCDVKHSGDFELMFLPWVSRAQLASSRPDLSANQQHAVMGDLFRDIVAAAAFTRTEGLPCIAATHFTIAGAAYNSGTQPNLGDSSEFMVPRTCFPANVCDLVVSGHIHKPQHLPNIEGLAHVFYPGSCICHDFGEEDQDPSGFADIHIMPSNPSFPFRIDTWTMPHTRFATIPIEGDVETAIRKVVDVPRSPSGEALREEMCVLRFKGTMPAGPESAALIEKWRGMALAEANVLKVAKPAITFTRHEHRAVSTITTATSPEDALMEYADVVGGDYVDGDGMLRDELLTLHKDVEKEVRA